MCAMPGVPCIYYGDEAGLAGADDPYNRRPYPWKSIDRELMDCMAHLNRERMDDAIWTEGDCRFGSDGDGKLTVTRELARRRVTVTLDRGAMDCFT